MKKVLYIENESLLRSVVKEMAQGLGHIAYVYDAKEDLSFYLKDIQPDLVLVDLPSAGEKTRILLDAIVELSPNSKLWATGWDQKLQPELEEKIEKYYQKPFDVRILLTEFFE
jgi:CheY-like chemotaxis protein